MVRLTGVEPAHMASEATALSTELQAHKKPTIYIIPENGKICKWLRDYYKIKLNLSYNSLLRLDLWMKV